MKTGKRKSERGKGEGKKGRKSGGGGRDGAAARPPHPNYNPAYATALQVAVV